MDELTFAEIDMALDAPDGKPRLPEGYRPVVPGAGAAAYARRRQEMTLAERVARAKEG